MKKYFLFLASCLCFLPCHGAENLPTDSPVRLGFVGLGNHMTEKLIPALDPQKFKMVYGCRRNLTDLTKQQEKYSFSSITSDYKEMLGQDKIDAIIVSGTPELHQEVVKAALEHNIHVFVEKPVALSLESNRSLSQLASTKDNLITAVGFNLAYIPSIEGLKQKVNENELDNLAITCTLGNPSSPEEPFSQTFESCFYFAFIHPVSVMVDVVGYPTDMQVVYKKGEHPQGFSLDIMATFEKKTKARIHFANCCTPGGFLFKISYDDKQGTHLIDVTQKSSSTSNEKQLSYQNELNAFYESIKSGQPHKNNLQRNLEVHEVLEIIRAKMI